MYEYTAQVMRVYDGDTIHVDIDLGFGVWIRTQSLRLLGIQAPEMGSAQGTAAKVHLADQILGRWVVVHTVKDKTDKYGRMLADIFLGDLHVNKDMIDSGYAVAWDGKGPRPLGY